VDRDEKGSERSIGPWLALASLFGGALFLAMGGDSSIPWAGAAVILAVAVINAFYWGRRRS
jgi:L-asparagine transporter-like permease